MTDPTKLDKAALLALLAERERELRELRSWARTETARADAAEKRVAEMGGKR